MRTMTIKDNHALRLEFIRSVFNLPGGDDNDALATGALFTFIKGTTTLGLSPADDSALGAYLSDTVRLRGQAGIDTDVLAGDVAALARDLSDGAAPFSLPALRLSREAG